MECMNRKSRKRQPLIFKLEDWRGVRAPTSLRSIGLLDANLFGEEIASRPDLEGIQQKGFRAIRGLQMIVHLPAVLMRDSHTSGHREMSTFPFSASASALVEALPPRLDWIKPSITVSMWTRQADDWRERRRIFVRRQPAGLGQCSLSPP